MRDPFLCDGPTNIAFSGGRTSGLMLRRTLDAHGGTLPADCRAIFLNTGREREETLEFVRDCGEQWGVDIVWVERRRVPGEPATAVRVTFDTASRNGEPFDALIDERSYLPNPVTRFCTEELKIKTTKRYLMTLGYEHWTSCVGLRFDEPKRVARIHASKRERETVATPLYDARITVADVAAFWKAQPFDLRLQSYEGNCDLCFLKGFAKRVRIIEERPELAAWWVGAERRIGATFRAHEPSYQRVLDWTKNQRRLPMFDDVTADIESVDCGCTD